MIIYKVVNCNALTIREKPSKTSKAVGYLKAGDLIEVDRDYKKNVNGTIWYKMTKGYVSSKYLERYATAKEFLDHVKKYNAYIKSNNKYFSRTEGKSATTFDSAVKLVKQKKIVQINCTTAINWAFREMDLTTATLWADKGKYKNFKGDLTKHMKSITKGGPVGLTVKAAISAGLLKLCDIICVEGLTHSFTYSGNGGYMYDGGSAAASKSYKDGIYIDYSKNSYKDKKISQILRFNH